MPPRLAFSQRASAPSVRRVSLRGGASAGVYRCVDIGKVIETITVEPLPKPQEKPVPVPEREKEGVPA